jgi:hypothetical protein
LLGAAAVSTLLAACGGSGHDTHTPGDGAGHAPEMRSAAADEGHHEAQAPSAGLVINTPWTRAIPPNAPVAAGYLGVVNGGAVDDRLISVRSAHAGRVEIHEMVAAGDGTMQMRELDGGLPVPGSIAVDLRPGGLHLMFFEPEAEAWQVGASVPATLVFEHAGEREVAFEVFAPGESPAMQGAGGDDHHEGHHGH